MSQYIKGNIDKYRRHRTDKYNDKYHNIITKKDYINNPNYNNNSYIHPNGTNSFNHNHVQRNYKDNQSHVNCYKYSGNAIQSNYSDNKYKALMENESSNSSNDMVDIYQQYKNSSNNDELKNEEESEENWKGNYNDQRNNATKQSLKYPGRNNAVTLKRGTRKLNHIKYKTPKIESNFTNIHISSGEVDTDSSDNCKELYYNHTNNNNPLKTIKVNKNPRRHSRLEHMEDEHIPTSTSPITASGKLKKMDLRMSPSEENIILDIFKKCANKEYIKDTSVNKNNNNNGVNSSMHNRLYDNNNIESNSVNHNNNSACNEASISCCLKKPEKTCCQVVENCQCNNANKLCCQLNYNMNQPLTISSAEFERRAQGKPSKSNNRSRLGDLGCDLSYCNRARAQLKRQALCIIEQKRYVVPANSGSDSEDGDIDEITRYQVAITSSDMRIGFLFRFGSKMIRKNAEDLRIEHERECDENDLQEKITHCERLLNYNASSSLKNDTDLNNLIFCKSCDENMDCDTKRRIQQCKQQQNDARKTLYSSGGASKLLTELINSGKSKLAFDYRSKRQDKHCFRGGCVDSGDDRLLDDDQLVNKYGAGSSNDPRFKIVNRKRYNCTKNKKNEKNKIYNCEEECSEDKLKFGKSKKSIASMEKRNSIISRNINRNDRKHENIGSKECKKNTSSQPKSKPGFFPGFSWIPKSKAKVDMGH